MQTLPHTHTHSLHQLGPGPVITSQSCRENFTEHSVIDICRSVCPYQPQIKAESRRQGSTSRSSGGLLHHPPPFEVCESTHQCVEPASTWHAGSPPPHPEQRTVDCLAVGACRVVVFRGERTGLFRQAGLGFFNRAPRRPAQADTPIMMIGRGNPSETHSSSSCQTSAHVTVFLFIACAFHS